jgi:hypothetical protein
MKKGNFNIKVRTENSGWKMEEVNGFYAEYFGIHRTGDTRRSYQFVVTHMKTGLALGRYDRMGLARVVVERIEAEKDWPMPWDGSTIGEDFRVNGPKALELIHEAKLNYRYESIKTA